MRYWIFFSLVLFFALQCSRKTDQDSASTEDGKPKLPVVSDSRTDLVLSWFGDGGAGVASSVKDVPVEAKTEVRVQDPTIPPEKRDPRWIFLADLTKSDDRGNYPVRAEFRSEFEAKRSKAVSRDPKPGGQKDTLSPPGSKNSDKVIMYATRHCPICHKARRWLLEKKIPYVERDLETDQTAAAELAKKGRAQGVPTNGVPIFEIHGRLVPGFDPPTIQKLMLH